jgi:DNA-binding GntR family transcriptional regulator
MKRIDELQSGSSSLRAQVFKEIEQAILDGVFAPGDNLAEMKISAELGVSRTPVREALRQLELEGLVRTIPNKGAVVVGISEKDVDDIYTIRSYIEGLAARWAADHVTDDEIGTLREIVELQEYYASRGDGLQVWHLDSRFHEMIYECCRSRPLKQTLTAFHHNIQNARALSFKTAARAQAAVQEHRNILEAIAKRDSAAAESLTAEHIKNARENFREGKHFNEH